MTGTYAAAVRRVLIGRVVATVGAAVIAAGTFLPWVRSGTRRRNSYEIFSLVDRLGFSTSSVVGWGIRLWPILPFLLATAITLLWFSRTWISALVAAVAVVYAAVVAIAVTSAPSSALVAVESGPVVALIGAASLAAGTALTASAHRLANRQ